MSQNVWPLCQLSSRRLFGRISLQFLVDVVQTRSAVRFAVKPSASRLEHQRRAGHRLCCSSSLTRTKKLPLSSSNGLFAHRFLQTV